MPTENSLPPPPKSPTGPANIPLSNDWTKKEEKKYVPNFSILAYYNNPIKYNQAYIRR